MSAGKLSLEEMLEKINSFTDVNKITTPDHPIKENNVVTSFAARWNFKRSENNYSNKRVTKEHKPAWQKKVFCL